MRECPKRVPVPKVTVDESSEDETSTQKRKQAAKKKKSNQAAAKKDSYEAILRNQMNQAHRKNSGINPLTKRQRASSTSDSDDSLVSSCELQEARKMTKYWKARCKELREDNVFLQEQVRAQQALLGSKLFTMEEQQNQNKKAALNHGSPAEEADVVAEPRAAQGLKPRAEANPGLLVKTNMKKRSRRS